MQRVQITLKPFMPPRSRESEIERERERGKQVIEKFFFIRKRRATLGIHILCPPTLRAVESSVATAETTRATA